MTKFDTWNQRSYNSHEGGDDVFILWEDGDGGYDWWITALVAKKVGDQIHYGVYSDSGCSCRGEYEDAPDMEFRPNLDWALGGLCEDLRNLNDWDAKSDRRAAMVGSAKLFAQKLRKGEVSIP